MCSTAMVEAAAGMAAGAAVPAAVAAAATAKGGGLAHAAAAAAAAAAAQGALRRRRANTRTLSVVTMTMAFAEQLVRQTAEQMWLRAFAGDTAAYALVRGRLESVTALLSFLVTPLVAGLSDAIGRRLLLIVSALAVLAGNALPLFASAHSSRTRMLLLLGARQMIYRIFQDLGQLVRQSALGDMFEDDMVALAEGACQ